MCCLGLSQLSSKKQRLCYDSTKLSCKLVVVCFGMYSDLLTWPWFWLQPWLRTADSVQDVLWGNKKCPGLTSQVSGTGMESRLFSLQRTGAEAREEPSGGYRGSWQQPRLLSKYTLPPLCTCHLVLHMTLKKDTFKGKKLIEATIGIELDIYQSNFKFIDLTCEDKCFYPTVL